MHLLLLRQNIPTRLCAVLWHVIHTTPYFLLWKAVNIDLSFQLPILPILKIYYTLVIERSEHIINVDV